MVQVQVREPLKIKHLRRNSQVLFSLEAPTKIPVVSTYHHRAQRKIPVVFNIGQKKALYGSTKNPGCFALSALPAQSRRSEPFGVARAACFERLADVFAKRDARTPSSQAICQTPRHTNHRSTSATVHPRARGSDNDHR